MPNPPSRRARLLHRRVDAPRRETHATAYADLVLAVRSAYFIGNPASSFSANVVMIRRALGAAPTSTNLRVLDFPRPGSYK